MMTTEEPTVRTLGDVLRDLGGVSADRVVWLGRPATEEDLLRTKGLELVDGLLVYKELGCRKALAEMALGVRLLAYARARNAGGVTMGSGPYRTTPGVVRRPDVAFMSWSRLFAQNDSIPKVAPAAPDLTVEFPTADTPTAEATRKRRESFSAGGRLYWSVNLDARTVAVFTDPDTHTLLTAADTLTGEPVLPGFAIPLAELFDDPQLNPSPQRT